MPHLRGVEKGEFLLLSSPMRATCNYMVKFTPKITKIQELPSVRPLGPHQGVTLDPLRVLRRPRDPMPLNNPPPPQPEFLDLPLP